MALTNKIKFLPSDINMYNNLNVLPPDPAIKHIPEWYKDLAQHYNTNKLEFLNPVNDRGTDGANVSTKMCYPFRDAMTAGYMYRLTEDLHVSLAPDGKPYISWENEDFLMLDKTFSRFIASCASFGVILMGQFIPAILYSSIRFLSQAVTPPACTV